MSGGSTSGWGSGTPYTGGTTTDGRQRREGEVGGGEALAAEVRATVGEQLRDEVELAPDRRPRPRPRPPGGCRARAQEAHGERPAEPQRAILPSRHALVVEAQHEVGLGEHLDVHEPPAPRPEPLVEAPAEPLDLGTLGRLGGEEPSLRRRTPVDPAQDLLRLAERALRRDQHRSRSPAARPARRDPVDALDVALLAVRDPGPLERPARLLAVMADRDRDEPQHASARIGRRRCDRMAVMQTATIELTGDRVEPADVVAVARHGAAARLSDEARAAMAESAAVVERLAGSDRAGLRRVDRLRLAGRHLDPAGAARGASARPDPLARGGHGPADRA